MIKTYEQFVNEMYSPVNEAFQSSKLREIIKTHGMPKWDIDKKMLYDIKDNEIIYVVNSRDEYYKKYSDGHNGEKAFIIELKDGSCIVIGNLKIFKWFMSDLDQDKKNVFNRRHAERHEGNSGTNTIYKKNRNGKIVKSEYTNDDIHKRHSENVNKIERRRLAEKLQQNIQEIVDAVESVMDNLDPSDFDGNTGYEELEITFGGEEYLITVNYDCRETAVYREYGAEYCDYIYSLNSFDVCDVETDICATNDDLGVTEKTHKQLFKEYNDEVECGIYNHYEYYGVDPSDFV